MMKFVHLITRMDRGGSAQNTLLSCLALADHFETVLAYGLSHESRMTYWEKETVCEQIEEAKARGIKVTPIPSLVRRVQPGSDLMAFFAIWRLLIEEKPVVVHTHTSKAGALGRWAAKLAGVPIIVHTPHGHVFYGHFNRVVARVFFLFEKITCTITDRLIALTEAEKNDYTRLCLCSGDKIVTIHSGVDTRQFMTSSIDIDSKKRALGISSEGLLVGTVGWLLPIKGPMHLLKAMTEIWQSFPRTGLVFAGKGDLERELRAEASRRGVSDRVYFLGWRNDIPDILKILDVFVLPSLNEGMGRVLAEAMAAGKPIVASRVGGILDLVQEGENGFLVPPGDVESLSFAIKELLGKEKLRLKMGETGRSMARNYSVEKMVEKLGALYSQLLSQSSSDRMRDRS